MLLSRKVLAFADYARAGPFIQDTNSGLYIFKCVYYVLYMPLHTWHTLHSSRPLSMFTAWIYMVEHGKAFSIIDIFPNILHLVISSSLKCISQMWIVFWSIWRWKSTPITRVLASALIHAAVARSFLSLVKSLSLLFTVGILKNETFGVFLLLLQP